ncbi:MAG: acyl carrier protein [Methylotenera sp.]|jgi:acyl carrier protein|nr:acyl carrier protein [Methylotenera sp.]
MTDDEILGKLKSIFAETFEISPETVKMETHLFEDLDLDSIDAVDLAIKLQTMTGKRIKPEDFKSVRTVGDVVGVAQILLVA